jgi:hypothetical protein
MSRKSEAKVRLTLCGSDGRPFHTTDCVRVNCTGTHPVVCLEFPRASSTRWWCRILDGLVEVVGLFLLGTMILDLTRKNLILSADNVEAVEWDKDTATLSVDVAGTGRLLIQSDSADQLEMMRTSLRRAALERRISSGWPVRSRRHYCGDDSS